jgi:DnaK suppressor protein
MASKKPAPKARKSAAKPAASAAGSRKPVAKAEPRKAAAAAPRRGATAPPKAAAASKAVAARPAGKAAKAEAPAKAAATPARPASPATKASPAAKPVPARPAPPPHPLVTTTRSNPRPAVESDDHDGADPGSLLAGPRNVKPYIAKRGEQYMGRQQASHFQQILLQWKRDLMEEVDRTVTHMKDEAANFPDPNDRATQEEEFSLELRTRDRERKLIRKIEEALKRIEDGSYGYCLETGEEIGIKRLEARPVATLSIEAQERRERRERQYGDRDDRYR